MIRTLIMAKAPIPGTTKTRLRLPPEGAASLQAALIGDAAEKALALGLGPVAVAGTPPDRLGLIKILLPEGVGLFAQASGDLGDRMLAATRRLFEEGPDTVLILGTDAPTLPPDSVRRAAGALGGAFPHDAAIIGSDDGGYVLLGLRRFDARLFEDMPWSSDRVGALTIERIVALGWSVDIRETLRDIDEPGDLASLPPAMRPALAQLPEHATLANPAA